MILDSRRVFWTSEQAYKLFEPPRLHSALAGTYPTKLCPVSTLSLYEPLVVHLWPRRLSAIQVPAGPSNKRSDAKARNRLLPKYGSASLSSRILSKLPHKPLSTPQAVSTRN